MDLSLLFGIILALVIVAFAVNSIVTGKPLDREWALLIGGLVGVVLGQRKVAQKRQEQVDEEKPDDPA